MNRDASRLSFFMPGAIPVQKGYQSIEIMDTVDKTTPIYVGWASTSNQQVRGRCFEVRILMGGQEMSYLTIGILAIS
jgi:hypothetical protein